MKYLFSCFFILFMAESVQAQLQGKLNAFVEAHAGKSQVRFSENNYEMASGQSKAILTQQGGLNLNYRSHYNLGLEWEPSKGWTLYASLGILSERWAMKDQILASETDGKYEPKLRVQRRAWRWSMGGGKYFKLMDNFRLLGGLELVHELGKAKTQERIVGEEDFSLKDTFAIMQTQFRGYNLKLRPKLGLDFIVSRRIHFLILASYPFALTAPFEGHYTIKEFIQEGNLYQAQYEALGHGLSLGFRLHYVLKGHNDYVDFFESEPKEPFKKPRR